MHDLARPRLLLAFACCIELLPGEIVVVRTCKHHLFVSCECLACLWCSALAARLLLHHSHCHISASYHHHCHCDFLSVGLRGFSCAVLSCDVFGCVGFLASCFVPLAQSPSCLFAAARCSSLAHRVCLSPDRGSYSLPSDRNTLSPLPALCCLLSDTARTTSRFFFAPTRFRCAHCFAAPSLKR